MWIVFFWFDGCGFWEMGLAVKNSCSFWVLWVDFKGLVWLGGMNGWVKL